jgi:hypothetical protein
MPWLQILSVGNIVPHPTMQTLMISEGTDRAAIGVGLGLCFKSWEYPAIAKTVLCSI